MARRVPYEADTAALTDCRLADEARPDAGTENVGWDTPRQPVRNGDAADLARRGLPPVPGSTIRARSTLHARPPETHRTAR